MGEQWDRYVYLQPTILRWKHTPNLKSCLLISYPWPNDTLYGITCTTYKQFFSPPNLNVLSLMCAVFVISMWAQSLLSPRERTSSEASSSQPTNNTRMLHLIPLWLRIAKWYCTRIFLVKTGWLICGVPIITGFLLDAVHHTSDLGGYFCKKPAYCDM